MSTFKLIIAATAALSTSVAAAQTKVPAPAQPAVTTPVKVSNDGQWEYLVISFGKTYFSSPVDIDAKRDGRSKLMIFGPVGGVVAQEALDTQAQVDTLGRYGWELVGVLGAIGGDQQWVFKRRYDPARAVQEEAQIRKEGAELAAARDKAAKEAAAKPVVPPPTELVDLDNQEARAKQAQLDQALRSRFTEALRLPGWSFAEINVSKLVASSDGTPSSISDVRVTLDVTQRVLSGNTYRRSTVQTIIDEYINSLKTQGRFNTITEASYGICLSSDGTDLTIDASLKFNNEMRNVGYAKKLYCVK